MQIKITKPAVLLCAADTRRRGKPRHQKQLSVREISYESSTRSTSDLIREKSHMAIKKSYINI